MAFVFYDTETTGLETAFDQILQFAAIKTDDDFNELERFEIRCRLRPDLVPSPGALLTTRVHPSRLMDASLPSHYEAILKIKDKISAWSPAIFLGYNSIGYDEELLRQALFQTLHFSYLTNTGGNVRGDVLKMAQAVSEFSPNSIAVPLVGNGKASFKLEQIAPQNGFENHDAHDAMGDVLATIHIARLIRQRCPEVWDGMMLTARKGEAIDLVMDEPILVLSERHFGKSYSWTVTYCGRNPSYDAQLGVFDLAHDPDHFVDLSVDELIGVLNKSPKVIRSVSASRQPVLMAPDMLPLDAGPPHASHEELMRRVAVIQGNLDFQDRVGKALEGRFAGQPVSPYVEKRIYDGFPDQNDREIMVEFHEVEWDKRPGLVDQFIDDRLQELGRRLIYLERPDVLPPAVRKGVGDGIKARMFSEDASVPWMTVSKALEMADELMESVGDDSRDFVAEIRSFLSQMRSAGGL